MLKWKAKKWLKYYSFLCEYFGRMGSWKHTSRLRQQDSALVSCPSSAFQRISSLCALTCCMCAFLHPLEKSFLSVDSICSSLLCSENFPIAICQTRVSLHFNSLIGSQRNAIKTPRHLQYGIFLFTLIAL